MAESPHYKELLRTLNDFAVAYLVVGGYAVMKYSEPRFTKDLDLWVSHSPANAHRLYQALAAFGAPLTKDGITPETFTSDRIVYQIGVAPVRVDISTHIDGVIFADAWKHGVVGTMFGETVRFLSLEDLIANKQAAGRAGDIEDLRSLQRRAKEI